ARGRGHPLPPPGGARRGGGGQARREMGRDAVRLRRAQARRQGLGNGDHRVLPRPPGQVQGAAGGSLRRAAEDLHGQDPEVPAARESKGDERHRYMSAVAQAREPLLLRDERDAICTLTMNRPQQMNALTQPVIARVQGAAAAAGCQLVAQCDLAVASEAAKFATPGVSWGFFCSTPGVAVGRNVLRKRAMELLLTADAIDAKKALEW